MSVLWGLQWFKVIRMTQQQIKGHLCIGGIILGAAGFERNAVSCQGAWIDWKDNDEVILLKNRDNGAFTQFQRYSYRSTKAIVQRPDPLFNDYWIMCNDCKFTVLAGRCLNANVVF
jgi:hypothetical protein